MTIGKRFLKFFFVTLVFVCLPVLAGLAGPAGLPACFGEPAAQAAAPLFGTQSIQDGARLLQQPERAQLTKALEAVELKHHIGIGIVTVPSLGAVTPDTYAGQLLKSRYNKGVKGNIVLVLDMQKRDWYVGTDEKMRVMISDKAGIKALGGRFTKSLSKGNYAEAFTAFVNGTEELTSYYEKEGKAYDPADKFSILALVVGAVLAAAGALGVRGWLRGTMSNVAPSVSVARYIEEGSFHLAVSDDQYLYTDRTERPLPQKSGSSESGGSGGGGGKF